MILDDYNKYNRNERCDAGHPTDDNQLPVMRVYGFHIGNRQYNSTSNSSTSCPTYDSTPSPSKSYTPVQIKQLLF